MLGTVSTRKSLITMSNSLIRLLNPMAILLSALVASGQTTETPPTAEPAVITFTGFDPSDTIWIDEPADATVEVPVSVGIPGRSSLSLELGHFPIIQTIVPIEPTPATVVAPGTRLTLRPSRDFGEISNVDWFWNGNRIATDTPELVIEAADSEDSGIYRAEFDGSSFFSSTSPTLIHVGTADRHRLVNMSSRATLSPFAPTTTVGFVIEPPLAGSFQGREVLIRVIGPSLGEYDVDHPLPDPVMALRNIQSGGDIGIGFPAVVYEDGTTPESRYYDRIREISATVGAFPIRLPDPQSDEPTDQAMLLSLSGGAYTVTVNSASGQSGDVLVEIYEVGF